MAFFDNTGNHSTTNINNIEVQSDGTNNALEMTAADSSALSYGVPFETLVNAPHTQIFIYKPKEIVASAARCIYGNTYPTGDDQYSIFQFGDNVRIFTKVNGVSDIIDTVNPVFTNLDYKIITLRISQNDVSININGVNVPITATTLTGTLADIDLDNIAAYIGARNNNGTLNNAGNGFLGEHLMFTRMLSDGDINNLIDYFV